MFKKSFKKSILTSSAVGGVMVASLLTAPAATTATVSNMGCGGYQGGVDTTTVVNLKRYVGHVGQRNKARAHVDAENGSSARGYVRITVVKQKTRVKQLRGGNARMKFGRHLKPGTYEVFAKFPKQGCYKKSKSKSKFYTVTRRR